MSVFSSDRILVIDDSSSDLIAINEALSAKGGFETHGVNYGDAALEHLATSPRLPDLILLDVNMPGMSGLEVLASIKMDIRFSDIPVILMTIGAGDDEEQGLEMGACDWVQKPIQSGSLVVRVHNQLKMHRAHKRAHKIAGQTKLAESSAIHSVADDLRVNIDCIQAHWDQLFKVFGADEDVCPSNMREELPALIHDLRGGVARMLRIAEGTD
jgi:DNA-binding response OmpR family regulator